MQNRNPEIHSQLRQQFGLQLADGIPSSISPSISPVVDVHPLTNGLITISKIAASSTSGASTYHTCDSSKDTYLLGATFSIVKDATCDMATGRHSMSYTLANGATGTICDVAILTLTAQSKDFVCMLPKPILLKRGTTIGNSGNTTFTAGACMRVGTVFVREVDPVSY